MVTSKRGAYGKTMNGTIIFSAKNYLDNIYHSCFFCFFLNQC